MNGDPATEASLQKMETELSQAAAAHDTAPFTKYLDDNVVALGPGWKASNKAEVLDGVKSTECTTTNAAVSGFSYKWLTPDIVLVSYMQNYTSTCKGKTTPTAEHENSTLSPSAAPESDPSSHSSDTPIHEAVPEKASDGHA